MSLANKLTLDDIERQIPEDNLLYKIKNSVDFNIVNKALNYDPNEPKKGRPAFSYIMMFKICLISILEAKSFRKTAKSLVTDISYWWFLDFIPQGGSVVSHATISRYFDTFTKKQVFKAVFEYSVEFAYLLDLVDGEVMFQDSTHIKAYASKSKAKKETITTIEEDNLDLLNDVNEIRNQHGIKKLKPKSKRVEKKVTISLTDKDSGLLVRENKPIIFCFLDHRIIDGKFSVILSTEISPGNVHDSQRCLSGFLYIKDTHNLVPTIIGVDSAYDSALLMYSLHKMGVKYVIVPYKKAGNTPNEYKPSDFTYNAELDLYLCPQGKELKYSTTIRNGYSIYKSNPAQCEACPFKDKCTRNKLNSKVVNRSIYQAVKDHNHAVSASEFGRKISKQRSTTIEPSFANSKEQHGYGKARFVGIEKMQSQAYLTSTIHNFKIIVKHLFDQKKSSS
ncbi:hypothetical protein CKF54_07635 [Psittacicella hinzii]|uniref:Transposase n=1 Tax=Psittacicella hinzii TaxID=2028575 RepID=A0A3A1Y1K2_9GAMM|nr:IS1182 family transposase [Psittacicella hinzii]RIY31108.1 hypothetical protein CKF54_07635 [Psittacicella hinzii]